MIIRRVATGENAAGESQMVSDAPVSPATFEGIAEAVLWGADSPPSFPVSPEMPRRETYYPPPGGYRFVVLTLQPERQRGSAPTPALSAAKETLERELGDGIFALWDPDLSGRHINDSVDLGVVLSGTVSLELDRGEAITLRTGDTFVQNGAHHRWINHGEAPARIAMVLIGGRGVA